MKALPILNCEFPCAREFLIWSYGQSMVTVVIAASLRMEKKRDWVRYESSQASPSATLLKTTFYKKKKNKTKKTMHQA